MLMSDFREPVHTTATLVRMYRNVSTYVPQLKQQQTNKQTERNSQAGDYEKFSL